VAGRAQGTWRTQTHSAGLHSLTPPRAPARPPRHCRRDPERLHAAVANLQQLAAAQLQQPRVSGTVCDVAKPGDVDRLQAFVAAAFGNGSVHR
jgi:hypothetical protein